MGYIDREQALSHPFANGKYDHDNANEHFILGFEGYREWLENLPTIDIVRCGECKWWKPVVYSSGEGGMVCVQTPLEPATKPDDFCSYGERRENL